MELYRNGIEIRNIVCMSSFDLNFNTPCSFYSDVTKHVAAKLEPLLLSRAIRVIDYVIGLCEVWPLDRTSGCRRCV